MNEDVVVAPDATVDVAPEVTEKVEETTEEITETVEEVKARLAKAEELAKNYKTRAENAEKKAKEVASQPVPKPDLSSRDIIAVTKANVHDDDIDRVLKFAKDEGLSVKDALANEDLKAMLNRRADLRKTAVATNTGSARRGSVKLSDEEVLERASRGEFPEDPVALAKAQLNVKRKKN